MYNLNAITVRAVPEDPNAERDGERDDGGPQEDQPTPDAIALDGAQQAQGSGINATTPPPDVDPVIAGEPTAVQPGGAASAVGEALTGTFFLLRHEVETSAEKLTTVRDDTGPRDDSAPDGTVQGACAPLTTFPEFSMAEFLAFDATASSQTSEIWWNAKTYDACRGVSARKLFLFSGDGLIPDIHLRSSSKTISNTTARSWRRSSATLTETGLLYSPSLYSSWFLSLAALNLSSCIAWTIGMSALRRIPGRTGRTRRRACEQRAKLCPERYRWTCECVRRRCVGNEKHPS